ncbi:MAG: DUF2851 family protein [Allomuricauda sp.]
MKEDLLHFIWGQNKLHGRQLTSTANEAITIKAAGVPNQYSGPDFFNAQVEIDGQLWAGNVEMHLKSSDWYAHHHETDEKYDNVILHVVWEDDVSVFRKDGSQIPTLALRQYVPKPLLAKYQDLLENTRPVFINCERDFAEMDPFLVQSWLDRLYIERLEHKSGLILELLQKSSNDWEAVLFAMLAKTFGSKVNGDFFLERALQLDFPIIRKLSNDIHALESLLFGHFGLLHNVDHRDSHFVELKKEYSYLTKKFGLALALGQPEFYGLRPVNFPTIRISQLAHLYAKGLGLFASLMESISVEDIHQLFETAAGLYWEDHFTFDKISKKSRKKLSKSFIDLLIINTIVPLKFCYSKHLGKDWNEELIALISGVKREDNSIIDGFGRMGAKTSNAMESQAQLQLYSHYCSKNKCLQCVLGAHLLNRNT